MIKRKAYSYIRMSTDSQLKGDSLRRQLDASEKYAQNNDLELIDSMGGTLLQDIGVSAFKGKNTQKGVLALFLEALEQGKIPKNSVLLIESLDRLSRERISNAVSLFINILNNDVEIVTLADNQRYTKEIIDNNFGAMYVSLGIMFRANEESQIKSHRLSAAWENKRAKSNSLVLTRNCPAWLSYSESKQKFELNRERAKVVKKIIQMCISTCGLYSIAKYLNKQKVPVFGTGKIWYLSYITKIISNRAIFGEFQPHHYVDGKRVIIGNPIKNYFPKVVDEQQYHLAQSAIARRTTNGSGRKGQNFSNLFSGITYCGLCGYKMMVRNRGGNHSSSRYLLCSNSLVNAGCRMNGWNLAEFESKIFGHLREINFEELINPQTDLTSKDKLLALTEKKASLDKKIEQAFQLYLDEEVSDETKNIFKHKITELENEKKETDDEILEIQKLIIEKEETLDLFGNNHMQQIWADIEVKKDDYFFRSTLNQYLHKMIDKIVLNETVDPYTPWEFSNDSEEIKAFRLTSKARQTKVLDKILDGKDFENFQRVFNRTVNIKYKGGSERYIMWGINRSMDVSSYHSMLKKQ